MSAFAHFYFGTFVRPRRTLDSLVTETRLATLIARIGRFVLIHSRLLNT